VTDHVISELRELDRLLAEAAQANAGSFIGGQMMVAGMEQRREDLISTHLRESYVPAAEQMDIGLTRSDDGTGAELSFVGGVLVSLQSSITAFAQQIDSTGTSRGLVPAAIQNQVAMQIAVGLPGSLNLRLVPVEQPTGPEPLFPNDEPSLLEESISKLAEALDASGSSVPEMLDAIGEAGPRATSHLLHLSKLVAESHATLELNWRSPRGLKRSVFSDSAARALKSVIEDVRSETNDRVYTGRIVGGSLVRKTFELELEDVDESGEPDSVLGGKVTDEVMEIFETYFGKNCTATIAVKESSLPSGEVKQHYTLKDLTP
jgi:hypothetical protein